MLSPRIYFLCVRDLAGQLEFLRNALLFNRQESCKKSSGLPTFGRLLHEFAHWGCHDLHDTWRPDMIEKCPPELTRSYNSSLEHFIDVRLERGQGLRAALEPGLAGFII